MILKIFSFGTKNQKSWISFPLKSNPMKVIVKKRLNQREKQEVAPV